jgi:hypothetical protein
MTRDEIFEPVEIDEYCPDEADYQETDASWWADYEEHRFDDEGRRGVPYNLYEGNEYAPDGTERDTEEQ